MASEGRLGVENFPRAGAERAVVEELDGWIKNEDGHFSKIHPSWRGFNVRVVFVASGGEALAGELRFDALQPREGELHSRRSWL